VIKLTPKRKLQTSQNTENYVDHITQVAETPVNQTSWWFKHRLRIPVGADKFG
jgi:hypothetical protein